MTQFTEVWQYGSDENKDPVSKQDGVAPQVPCQGIDANKQRAYIPDTEKKGFLTSHSIGNYGWIFDGTIKKGGQVMLHRGNKKIVFAFLFVMILFSCTKEKSSLQGNKYLYFNKSISIMKTDGYYNVFNNMQDSLKLWCHVKLQAYGELWYYNYKLDSLLCFNSQKNKVIGALLIPCTKGDCLQDDIRFFYGIKIKGKWYFFSGATIVLPREFYQKDIHTPLSFSKLHEIAMQEVFSGYLVRKKKDAGFWKNIFAPEYEYEVNESWFDAHFKNKGICSDCKTEEDFEKVWLYNSQSQWKNK